MLATPPFGALTAAINIFKVNVRSTDSGVDDPIAAGGTGATCRTYFDAAFGFNDVRRLLVCNAATALDVALTEVPEFDVALVVVNSTIYGGSGATGVATCSLEPSATEIALHEMGHSIFGLADEYAYYAGAGEVGHDHHPGPEPLEPNVTVETDPARLKWAWAVAVTTPIPTMINPDCAEVDNQLSTDPPGTVGLFEGAHYYHCGAYRPQHDCKMRNLGADFCRVCQRVISHRVSRDLEAG